MKLYSVEIEERRRRVVDVVAPSEAAAKASVGMRATRSGLSTRILGVCETQLAPSAPDGLRALDHLLNAKFLPIRDTPQTLRFWVLNAEHQLVHEHENTEMMELLQLGLSRAGLRVSMVEEVIHLSVAGDAVPFLPQVFAETPWAKNGWRKAFMALPGATPGQNTFAGIRSRSARIPLRQTLDALNSERSASNANLH
ncbi:hypothetical protein [Shimia sp.]|uniref:hypothetical protein n=1 Tax=Shimia sp. TaxID=1954381 RepID=UPI003BA97A8C